MPARCSTGRRNRSFGFLNALRIGALGLFTLAVVAMPLWVLFVNSAKPLQEAQRLGIGMPEEWALVENYTTVITEGKVFPAAVNTLILVLPVIAATVLL